MVDPFYQYGLELTGGTDPQFFVGAGTGVMGAPMGTALPFGQWTHVAVSFDGASARFYRDGVLVATQPLAATIVARGNSLAIGADNQQQQFFLGLLDEVRIYQRALGLAEVQADMRTPF
jgi:hypothetical protein